MATTDTPAEAKRRVRAASEYRVERCDGADTDQIDKWYACAEGVTDTAAGIRWIKKNGEAGKTYRVARVCSGPVTVTVEKVEKRTLT